MKWNSKEETKDNISMSLGLMVKEMGMETTEGQKCKGQMERNGITNEMILKTLKCAVLQT